MLLQWRPTKNMVHMILEKQCELSSKSCLVDPKKKKKLKYLKDS